MKSARFFNILYLFKLNLNAHPRLAGSKSACVVYIAFIIGSNAEVIVFLVVHVPLRVIEFIFNLCPAVTAAVAGVNLFIAYSLGIIRVSGAIAVAVALSVYKQIIGAHNRPVHFTIRRIMRNALKISGFNIIKRGSEFFLPAHVAVCALTYGFASSEKRFVLFAEHPGRFALDYAPIISVDIKAIAVFCID